MNAYWKIVSNLTGGCLQSKNGASDRIRLRAPFIAQKKYLRIVGELMDADCCPYRQSAEKEGAEQQGCANREKS